MINKKRRVRNSSKRTCSQFTTKLFLDSLMLDISRNPEILEPYTEEEDAELEKLLEGVVIDD